MDYGSVFVKISGIMPSITPDAVAYDEWYLLARRISGNVQVKEIWGADRHAPTRLLRGLLLSEGGAVVNHYADWYETHNALMGRCAASTSDFDYLKKRIHPATRAKSSKALLKDLVKAGFSPKSKWVQDVLMEWAKKFKPHEYAYSVHWGEESFHMLGTIPNVDTSSCYRASSEYWPDAPTTLAERMYADKMTFVIFIRDKDEPEKILARCWGWYDPDTKGFVVTNGYYGPGVLQDISIFRRAMEEATGRKVLYFKAASSDYIRRLRVYVNGDMCLCATERDLLDSGGAYPPALPCTHACMVCGYNYTMEMHGFYHALCGNCSSEVPSPEEDEEEDYEEDYEECPVCGGSYLAEDMRYCYTCSEDICVDCIHTHQHCTRRSCVELRCTESGLDELCEGHWQELLDERRREDEIDEEEINEEFTPSGWVNPNDLVKIITPGEDEAVDF